mmetsp:Transcript_9863/g.19938  ORF Transcript_9863/g.19938 Transcript_9863/m.19938 type:complete len:202 (+) Transcript_9863:391-996(+)
MPTPRRQATAMPLITAAARTGTTACWRRAPRFGASSTLSMCLSSSSTLHSARRLHGPLTASRALLSSARPGQTSAAATPGCPCGTAPPCSASCRPAATPTLASTSTRGRLASCSPCMRQACSVARRCLASPSQVRSRWSSYGQATSHLSECIQPTVSSRAPHCPNSPAAARLSARSFPPPIRHLRLAVPKAILYMEQNRGC